jgi:hypothetical protein
MLATALLAIAAVTGLVIVLAGGELAEDDAQAPGDATSAPTATAPEGDEAEPAPEVRYDTEPPANWDVTGVAAADTLNVRTGPGVTNPVTATLAPGTIELESSGRIAYVDGTLWREIKVPGATTGWVNARYLAEYAPPAVLDSIGIGLPAPAMTTAREIFLQADRGSLEDLAGLALAGDTAFTASFGDPVITPEQLVALWEEIGREEVLRTIVALVSLPDWYGTATTGTVGAPVAIYVTPRFMHEATAANRALLEESLGADVVEASIVDGQWLGWRLGIDADGDWRFFVAGD